MKQFSVCLVLILLLSLLVGCTRGKNVSDDANGSITDSTMTTTLETSRRTEATTHESSASETSEGGMMESSGAEDTERSGIAPRGMLGGERF